MVSKTNSKPHTAKKQDLPHKRTLALAVFLLCAFGVIVFRLTVLQIVSADYYEAMAEDQYSVYKKLAPVRGEIKITDQFSQDSLLVATNVEKPIVYAVPGEVQDVKAAAEKLAPLIGLDAADIEERLSDTKRKYVVLKRQLSEQDQKAITDLRLAGINFDTDTVRYYPERTFLSHALGFVGYKDTQRVGLYGLEKSFEEALAGKPGVLSLDRGAGGAWIFGGKRDFRPAVAGENLLLTIDRSIQFKAELIAKETMEQHQADRASIIVMDPKTGAILAMAGYPNFDPNEYSKVEDPAVFNNVATVGNYEPGSIFKPLTMAAAIDAGKVTPDSIYYDSGKVEIDGYTIKNSDEKSHGIQTMTQVLEESLNTGVIYAKDKIGNVEFLKYVRKFGFGAKTGVELPETAGNLDNLKGNIAVNYHTASFGQGISVTPIQMVQAYSALANGGKMIKPHIIQARVHEDGMVDQVQPQVLAEVVKPDTASKVSAMLVNVVENGHGKRAKVPGYYIGGKTGTAEVSKSDGKGYQEHVNIGSFIGYGPIENPRFIILVRVDHPRTVQYAESTAAPAFGQLAQFILNYYNIPPTRK